MLACMSKVMLDSSVWVSLFAEDKFFDDADVIIKNASQIKAQIIVPSIVYFEVLNVLGRLGNMFQEKARKAFY